MSDSSRRQPFEIIAEKGSIEILQFLDIHGKSSEEDLLTYADEEIPPFQIKKKLAELQGIGFVNKFSSKNKIDPVYTLTPEGKEAIDLIDVINGAPLSSVFETKNRHSDFTLITHDMTSYFIDELSCQRDFQEIYICSPWIRLDSSAKRDLTHILESSAKIVGKPAKIHVLTRPLALVTKAVDTWNIQINSTIEWLSEIGAEISYVPNLHTKLFIILGRNFEKALFGSENLTGAKNIELGIRIIDPQIVDKLYIYWEDIYSNSISRQ